jgi:enhancing lycopene biosynthesis protein 2
MGDTKPRIAVVLSGCGVFDGAEIHESVLTLLAIARHGADYECFAPDIPQHHVLDHITGAEMPETRNVLVESARIARGKIRNLRDFNPTEFDALIFPGGFGAAKNLSSFAFDGADCSVDPDVAHAVRSAHAAGKPIGALCIAPVILAKLLGRVDLTIGQCAETSGAIEKMGAHHKTTTHGEIVVDTAQRLVTSPCYMLDARIDQIADGADNTVKALLDMVGHARLAAE